VRRHKANARETAEAMRILINEMLRDSCPAVLRTDTAKFGGSRKFALAYLRFPREGRPPETALMLPPIGRPALGAPVDARGVQDGRGSCLKTRCTTLVPMPSLRPILRIAVTTGFQF
jgi:hypothetical protein